MPGLDSRTSMPGDLERRVARSCARIAAIATVLVAPDSFKGTFRAPQVAAAIGRGLERAGLPPPDLCPVADGGEGTMEVLLHALGGETAGAAVHDPLGRPAAGRVRAARGRRDGGRRDGRRRAGSGSWREDERDAEAASTRGTGELIAAAVERGRGRSCSSAAAAARRPTAAPGAIEAIEEAGGLRGARLVVLCDVRTPFERAARGVRAAEGRRRGGGAAADPAAATSWRAALAARPARRGR